MIPLDNRCSLDHRSLGISEVPENCAYLIVGVNLKHLEHYTINPEAAQLT